MLLDVAAAARAEVLGLAFRLAYTLSAGTAALLGATALALSSPGLSGQLVLRLESGTGVFDGDGISRRLDRLAEVLGLESATEIVAEAAAPR
jgi:exopolyphosphatase/guanosine-5'-triphosphate,3'-diphosphate pyrophosphatase